MDTDYDNNLQIFLRIGIGLLKHNSATWILITIMTYKFFFALVQVYSHLGQYENQPSEIYRSHRDSPKCTTSSKHMLISQRNFLHTNFS